MFFSEIISGELLTFVSKQQGPGRDLEAGDSGQEREPLSTVLERGTCGGWAQIGALWSPLQFPSLSTTATHCERNIAVRDSSLWETRQRPITVRYPSLWEAHLCERPVAVRHPLMWETHLCERPIAVRDPSQRFWWETVVCTKFFTSSQFTWNHEEKGPWSFYCLDIILVS